ncbi:MAG: protein-tyrosine phosphatase family protein [Actinomycetota bacterium]
MRNLLIGFLLFLVVGNLVIFGAFKWMAATDANYSLPPLPGIKNLTAVDHKLWRGSAPTDEGYRALARKDVKVIVDLRAEDLEVDSAVIESLGMELVRIPMRDGQAPTDSQVQKFLSVMKDANGRVYVHCGAGVGRTGTMSAAYLVLTGRASAMEAVQRNLAVGPPSLEQIAFAAGLDEGEEAQDVTPLTIVSRVLDAPRRLLVRVRHSYQ